MGSGEYEIGAMSSILGEGVEDGVGVSSGTEMLGAICMGVIEGGSCVLGDSCCYGCGDGM